jgi:CDP-diacylglycerol--glycerol-3-phosphate 3-phosphatidyltransferase
MECDFMTLPNKLTMFRIILIPLMVVIAYIPFFNENFIGYMSLANFINIIIFTVASLTDFLDGYIARKYNLVTTFGKFADPLADKLLVISAMVILCTQIQAYSPEFTWFIPGWVIIVILCREFIVSGIRLVAVERGKVIAAGFLGKLKTATTMVALIFLFLYQVEIFELPIFGYIGAVMMYLALGFTILSGIEYFWKNRKVILESI